MLVRSPNVPKTVEIGSLCAAPQKGVQYGRDPFPHIGLLNLFSQANLQTQHICTNGWSNNTGSLLGLRIHLTSYRG